MTHADQVGHGVSCLLVTGTLEPEMVEVVKVGIHHLPALLISSIVECVGGCSLN